MSWNCNQAFRNKAKYLLEFDADMYVIQESEDTSKLNIEELKSYPNRIWIGNNNNKGLLVVAKENINIEIQKEYNPLFRYILPVKVSGQYAFNLFAVWAQNDINDRNNRYIGQVWLAIQEYKHLLQKDTILIGDFNSNTIWDKGHLKTGNHSKVVEFLENNYITSLYHRLTQEKQGEERTNTLAFRKDMMNQFHIDYCFLSQSFINENTKINILGFVDWIAKSDHVPMVIDTSGSTE
ncbi:endonuclease/exonuclease/phosphatase family protein [Paenibacillus sp. CMAA1364]